MNATEPTPPPSPPGSEPGRRLTRSTDDKVLGGLCAGLGRYFGIDPIVFRVAFVVLALAGGSGVFLYLVGWLLVPDDQGASAFGDRLRTERTRQLVLAVLLGVGLLLLVDGFDHGRGPRFPVGLVLIALGAAFLWTRRDRLGPTPPSDSRGGPSAPTSPSTPPAATAAPAPASDVPSSLAVPPPPTAPAAPSPAADTSTLASAAAARPPRPRSVLVPVTLSTLAVLSGLLALLRAPVAVILAVALLVTGVALVVGAWRGRARWLIPVAIVLGVALAAASVLDVPIRGGTGDRIYRPTTLGELAPSYSMAAGELVLDLRDLDLRGGNAEVSVTDGVGHVQVIVPPTARVIAVAHAGAGDVRLFEGDWGGTHLDKHVTVPGQEGAGTLVVRARVGIGQVEVLHAEA